MSAPRDHRTPPDAWQAVPSDSKSEVVGKLGPDAGDSTIRKGLPTIPSSLFWLLTNEQEELYGGDSTSRGAVSPSLDGPETTGPETTAPRWPDVGDVFLGFRLERLIGRGGLARVYLASQSLLPERKLVVKIAPFAGREAEILVRLERHENIMAIHSIERDHARHLTMVAMPYYGEATLEDLIPRRDRGGPKLPRSARAIVTCARPSHSSSEPAEILRHGTYAQGVAYLGLRMASALAHAHARGIHHRDLKPANVLLTTSGEPCLLDFNLAVENVPDVHCAGGTIPYLAPERLEEMLALDGFPRRSSDPRGDVFSLGIVLYQLLSGRLPFGAPSRNLSHRDQMLEMLRRLQTPPVSLSELNPQVDEKLAEVVQDCLQRTLERRVPSATALEDRLRAWAIPAVSRRQRIRNAVPLLTAVLSCLLLLGGFLAGGGLRRETPDRLAQQGTAALRLGKSDEAILRYLAAIAAEPHNHRFHYLLGTAYQRKGDWAQAKKSFHEAFRLSGDPASVAVAAYCASHTAGPPQIAIALYDMAIRGGYQPAWVLCNQAALYRRAGLRAHAQGPLRQLNLAGLNSPLPFFLRMVQNLETREDSVEVSLSDAQQALALAEGDPAIHWVVARVFGWKLSLGNLAPDEQREIHERTRFHLRKAISVGRHYIAAATPIPQEIIDEVLQDCRETMQEFPVPRVRNIPPAGFEPGDGDLAAAD